jgi:hypothetical protein
MNRIEAFEASLHGSKRAQSLLLRRYGIAPTEGSVAVLSRYAVRVRRARWWGVAGVLIASGLGWLGPSVDAAGWNLSLLLTGYLIGSGVAEFASPKLQQRGSVHAASLSPRVPATLLPVWARILPWLTLVPCLAAPMLLVGHHPVGGTRSKDSSGSVGATAVWFPPSVLVGTAVFALAALVVWRVTLRALTARPLALDRVEAAQVDILTRALSARAVSGAAAAVGLLLLGGLCFLSAEPLMSRVCTSVGDCHYVYGWHNEYSRFQDVGGLVGVVAVLLFWFSRLPRVSHARLRTTAPSS